MAFHDKKTVYHSRLVQAGTVEALITGDPQKSKFKKDGHDQYWVGLKIDGDEYQFTLENDTVKQKLTGLRNHVVQLTATGSREEADIDVYDAAGPMKQPPQQPQGRQQSAPQTRQQSPPPSGKLDGIVNAKKHLIQSANAYVLAYGAAVYASGEILERYGAPMSAEHFQAMTSSLFIALDRVGGAIQQIPAHPLPPADQQAPPQKAPPKKQAPPPPPPEPEPEPDVYDDPDAPEIPF